VLGLAAVLVVCSIVVCGSYGWRRRAKVVEQKARAGSSSSSSAPPADENENGNKGGDSHPDSASAHLLPRGGTLEFRAEPEREPVGEEIY